MAKVAVDFTEEDVVDFADSTLTVFKEISELASKQAFSLVDVDYFLASEELEKIVFTLKASEDLKEQFG